jgi:hypothetical protein
LDERLWEQLAVPPDGLAEGSGENSRAIAPDGGIVMYAWGDDLWLYREPTPARLAGLPPIAPPLTSPTPPEPTATPPDPSATPSEPTATAPDPTPTPPDPTATPSPPTPDASHWTLLRRSRRLAGFLPGADGGWAIADAGAGSVLLAYRGEAFHALAETRRLSALDGGATEAWAVGEAGTTLRMAGGQWRSMPSEPPIDGDLLDVAAVVGEAVWAAGVGPDGHGRLWHRSAAAGQPVGPWVEVGRTRDQTPLRAVAALPGGQAWAVGDRCVLLSVAPGEAAARQGSPCGAHVRDPVDLATVAAAGPRSLWTGGAYRVYHWDGRAWTVLRPKVDTGKRITALAAAPGDDVWAVIRGDVPRGREASEVAHLQAGTWHEDTLVNVPVREVRLTEAPDGRRTVWLAGDGATVLRRTYAPAR